MDQRAVGQRAVDQGLPLFIVLLVSKHAGQSPVATREIEPECSGNLCVYDCKSWQVILKTREPDVLDTLPRTIAIHRNLLNKYNQRPKQFQDISTHARTQARTHAPTQTHTHAQPQTRKHTHAHTHTRTTHTETNTQTETSTHKRPRKRHCNILGPAKCAERLNKPQSNLYQTYAVPN